MKKGGKINGGVIKGYTTMGANECSEKEHIFNSEQLLEMMKKFVGKIPTVEIPKMPNIVVDKMTENCRIRYEISRVKQVIKDRLEAGVSINEQEEYLEKLNNKLK